MIQLIIGFILGIAAATVGFQGMAEMADEGIDKVKDVVVEVSKNAN